MSPRIHLVAVHGTFATGAAWTKEGSRLLTRISDELPSYKISSSQFEWSGDNTHEGRERAAVQLCEHIRSIRQTHQSEALYIVAHSHGGNVALLALNLDRELDRTTNGVICLATPFLWLDEKERERRVEGAHVGAKAHIAGALAALLGTACSHGMLINKEPLWSGVLIVVIVIASVLGALEMVRTTSAEPPRALGDPVQHVYDFSNQSTPLLVVRTPYDEAFLTLRIGARVAMFAPVLLLFLILHYALSKPGDSLLYSLFIFAFGTWPAAAYLGYVNLLGESSLRKRLYGESSDVSLYFRLRQHVMPRGRPNVYEANVSMVPAIPWISGKLLHSLVYESRRTAKACSSFVLANLLRKYGKAQGRHFSNQREKSPP